VYSGHIQDAANISHQISTKNIPQVSNMHICYTEIRSMHVQLLLHHLDVSLCKVRQDFLQHWKNFGKDLFWCYLSDAII